MHIKQSLPLLALLLLTCLTAFSANVKTTVSQVSEPVTVTADEDYIINGETPFAAGGSVDLQATAHAVLILERVKPSVAIASWLPTYVKIQGERARNGVNCQVRLYGTRGSMILPYAVDDAPLTVYSEPHFQGEQCQKFGLENDGGYMVTMTDEQLNNRIRSFRLKRGYMVTFATGRSGYGYQRCFIANSEDLELATLPQILDQKISSYRIFKWNTAGKKGLASSTNATACDALNVISCYGWNEGREMGPDVECVANHLYEDYPSSSTCGKATWTCHMKTNNEPRNSSDDHPQSLETILANWQNLMRTGMRLCSPSSWDGSDYTDGTGFLNSFFQAIDARGWRCDIADVHSYWLTDNFDKLGAMQSKYKRPLWVSEWIWGASWNKNGIFESGKTDWDNEWAVKTICGKLNSYGYVERYFYWNSESKGKVYDNGLTVAGQWYADQLTGMGYNPKYEKIPELPPMKGGFRDFRVTTTHGQAIVTWHDYDGEYSQLMELLRKEPGGAWTTWQTIRPEDEEADYTVVDDHWSEGVRYRLHIRSYSGRDYYSSEDVEPGEAIQTSLGLRYVGGNVVTNGQFRMGTTGWTNGAGDPIGQPWFEVFPSGMSEGRFLQAFANHGKTGEGSLLTVFDIEPHADYVLRLASQDAGTYVKLDARQHGATTDANMLTMANTDYWRTQQGVFNSGDNQEALLSFRWLGGKARLGDIELCRLFANREDALADGVMQMRRKAAAVMAWNTLLPSLNQELQRRVAEADGTPEQQLELITLAVDHLLQAVDDQQVVDSLLQVARTVSSYAFAGRATLLDVISEASVAPTSAAAVSTHRRLLTDALAAFLPMMPAKVQPQSASLVTTDGWTVKAGTFTGGDQRVATHEEKTCWNAWWSGVAASQGAQQTMTILQSVTGLEEGLYQLSCQATTQHYCLSDQHAFLQTADEQAVSPLLTHDYLDVPGTVPTWQSLTTTPVYVSGLEATLTLGFTGSKQGAVDNAWRRYGTDDTANNKGDQREGWWCATDFQLLFHPLYKRQVTPQQWGAVCLPYAYPVPDGVRLYRIVGLLADYAHLCLEPVEQVEAGMPYIYRSEQPVVIYCPHGTAVTSAIRTENNFRGNFVSYGQTQVGHYQLNGGVWKRCTERSPMDSYSAIITKCEGMTVISDWQGETMPIEGVKDELGEPTSVTLQHADRGASQVRFDAQGRRLSTAKGLVVMPGKKVIVR